MPPDRAGQHLGLDVAAGADHRVLVVGVVDAHHVLLDDRALVEVGGHVVRGRADELDAAVEGLVVGLGALEARQERVVDVDRAARQRAAQVVGQHLHVAGQHDEVDVVLLRPARSSRASACGLVSGVTGTCSNGTP